MNTLPTFPSPPPLPPVVDNRPDTTKADTEAAREAWGAAIAAIDAAWKITPGHMLRTRMTIRRGDFNQGIALAAAHAMREAANAALKNIAIQERARQSGCDWAAATDAEAVQ